jgi:hypothetical protein
MLRSPDRARRVIPRSVARIVGQGTTRRCIWIPRKQFPTHDGIPVADMIKTIIGPAIEGLEKAVGAKSNAKFTVAFDQLTSACNTCHAGANKPFIRIQRPTESPLSNQNFAPGK